MKGNSLFRVCDFSKVTLAELKDVYAKRIRLRISKVGINCPKNP